MDWEYTDLDHADPHCPYCPNCEAMQTGEHGPIVIDGEAYCPDCVDKCAECGLHMRAGDAIEVGDDCILCEDCAGEPEPTPRKFTLRRISDAQPGELIGTGIEGLDMEPAGGYVWRAPETPDDVDRIISERQAVIDATKRNIAELEEIIKAKESNIRGLILAYQDVFPKPADGKSYKDYRGKYSGGNYRNAAFRLPELRVVDRDKAQSAGVMVTPRPELSITAARELLAKKWKPGQLGLELVEQPAVSFTPKKAH